MYETRWLVAIFLIFVGVLYGLVVWQRAPLARMYEFLGEVKIELRKVNWPVRREVVATTSVVIAAVFFFGIYLSLVDILVTYGRVWLFHAAGVGGNAL